MLGVSIVQKIDPWMNGSMNGWGCFLLLGEYFWFTELEDSLTTIHWRFLHFFYYIKKQKWDIVALINEIIDLIFVSQLWTENLQRLIKAFPTPRFEIKLPLVMGSSIYHRQSLESIITPRHIVFFKIPNFPPEIGAPNGTPNLRLIQTPRVREKPPRFACK